MHAEDRDTVVRAGQVHEHNLAKTALTDLLRRELADVVGGGEHEHVLLLLHPVQEEADGAGGLAAIRSGR